MQENMQNTFWDINPTSQFNKVKRTANRSPFFWGFLKFYDVIFAYYKLVFWQYFGGG